MQFYRQQFNVWTQPNDLQLLLRKSYIHYSDRYGVLAGIEWGTFIYMPCPYFDAQWFFKGDDRFNSLERRGLTLSIHPPSFLP